MIILLLLLGGFLRISNSFMDYQDRKTLRDEAAKPDAVEAQSNKALSLAYMENDPIITKWINQNNELAIKDHTRKQISYWEYVPEHADSLWIKFRGETEMLLCLLNISLGIDGPYVENAEAWSVFDETNTITIPGYTIFDFPAEQIAHLTELEAETDFKITYQLSKVNEVQTNGLATFNMLEYENCTPLQFKEIYNVEKIEALINFLTAESGLFKTAVLNKDGYSLTVC